MTPKEFHQATENFQAYYDRFVGLLPRSQVRHTAQCYLQGLLLDAERKHCTQIAQATGASPDAIQRLLNNARWDADAVRDALHRWIVETATVDDEESSPQPIVAIGETTFPKRGQHSVGVHRHKNALTNKRQNGQVGLFMSYDPRGLHRRILIDRCLFLPQEWCQDDDRRRQAHIPEEIGFRDKSALALKMLEHAWKMGVPMEWVVGDTICGDAPYLRDAVDAHNCQYVFTISPETLVWPVEETNAEPSMVEFIVKGTPPTQWQPGLLGQGQDDWLELQVVPCRDGRPGFVHRLLAQRRPTQAKPLTYYLSNAPTSSSLMKLATMAASRMTVHDCLEVARREVGLADYETRYWHGWYRHITLAMIAMAWKQTEYLQATRRADLKQWLVEHDMKISALAKKISADHNHLSDVLKGRRPFSDNLAVKLNQAGVTLSL